MSGRHYYTGKPTHRLNHLRIGSRLLLRIANIARLPRLGGSLTKGQKARLMAVRKTEPTRSTDDAGTSVDALPAATPNPSTEQAARVRRQQTQAQGPDTMIWALSLYLMRLGIALMASFEAIYFILDGFFPPPLTRTTTALHAAAVTISLLLLGATTRKWFAHYWRLFCFTSILAVYGLTLAICLLSGHTEPLFITVALS